MNEVMRSPHRPAPGATDLVGPALLSMLLARKHYRSVHVLLRRAAPEIEANAKLNVHQVDFARLPGPSQRWMRCSSRSAPRSR
jgi:hypothetical protein